MDFICKDFNSTLTSVSRVMGVSEDKIVSILEDDWVRKIEMDHCNDDIAIDDFGEYIFTNGFPATKLPVNRPVIHWFHGTRVIEPDVFLKTGILPLLEIYPKIKLMIDEIAKKLHISTKECTTECQKHYRQLADMKLMDSKRQGGPFAMQMYEASVNPGDFDSGNYTQEPEIITDYAYTMYASEAELILKEFKIMTVPVVVEFIEPNTNNEILPFQWLLHSAISYLYRIIHNEKPGCDSNNCFSNYGQAIPANLIANIHRVL